MNILDRLKLEINNQQYFTDEEFKQLLDENDLVDTETFIKEIHYRNLLFTVLDILENVSNDIDVMRRVTTEFSDSTTAYKYLADRIQQIRDKINALPDQDGESSSPFSLLFTRKPRADYMDWKNHERYTISNDEIKNIMK